MLTAIFADIHANREAFDACLLDAERAGAERYVFLGDLVGYGPDPAYVVERVAGLAGKGAQVLRGNHDEAVYSLDHDLGTLAAAAIEWTRDHLSTEHVAFLRSLPLTIDEGELLFVHASACAPHTWIYLLSALDAERSLKSTSARITICGHTHIPALYHATAMTAAGRHIPRTGKAIPLTAPRRWVAVLGAVGQPRDGNPAACFGLLDPERWMLRYVRVPYDAEVTAHKIRRAGLPEDLAKRLIKGH